VKKLQRAAACFFSFRSLSTLRIDTGQTGDDQMSQYVFSYYAGKEPESPEAGAEGRAEFGTWLGSLGDAVVNPGTPLGPSKTVSSKGVSENGATKRLTGFSIIKAESMDAALEMAKSCPFLEMGTIDVAEAFEM
jgi:hypothetical protein